MIGGTGNPIYSVQKVYQIKFGIPWMRPSSSFVGKTLQREGNRRGKRKILIFEKQKSHELVLLKS